MKKTAFIMVSLILAVISVSVGQVALGATLGGGEIYSLPKADTVQGDLYVGAGEASLLGEVLGDLTIAGGNLTIDGVVNGNLYIAGGEITVTEIVRGDATVVGGRIHIIGNISDDLRIAGGDITIGGNVTGDLVAAGGRLRILSGSTITGDLVIVGGEVIIDGKVVGISTIKGGDVTLNGTIIGDSDIKATEKFTIGDDATVGNLSYKAPEEAVISESTRVRGEISYTSINKKGGKTGAKAVGAWFFGALAMTLTFGILAVLFAKKGVKSVVNTVLSSPVKRILVGFVALVVVPILVILLLITVLGIAIAFPLALLYGALIMIALALDGVVAGSLIYKYLSKERTIEVTWLSAILGIISLSLVTLIPVVGWIIGLLFFLATFGSLLEYFYYHLWQGRS